MIDCPYHCGGFRSDLGIIVCRPTGVLTPDLAADLLVCQKCLEMANFSHVDRFHDLTSITAVHLDFSNILHMCETEERFLKLNNHVKACYLVSNPVIFGTIRMYQSLAENRGISVYVNYDLGELAAELGINASKLIF